MIILGVKPNGDLLLPLGLREGDVGGSTVSLLKAIMLETLF
jgi:hypothetical protein